MVRNVNTVLRCKGCKKVYVNPQADNWSNWQLCYKCARVLHPEIYSTKLHHGTGTSKMNIKIEVNSLIAK
jgi:hypothetical protein